MPKTPNTCQGITDFNSELIMDFVEDRNRNPQELIAISKGLTNTIKVNADRLKYYVSRGEKPEITFYDN